MKHLRKLLGIIPLLIGLSGPMQMFAQTPDASPVVQEVPTYEAETITVQTAWLDDLLADRDNLAVWIALILGVVIVGSSVFEYLRARSLAKTDEERRAAENGLKNRLIAALEDANTRNALERKIMAEEMLPVRTVLELVEASARIMGDATQSALLKALGGFLEDVTETTPGEDLGINLGTSGGEPASPQSFPG